MVNMMLPKSDKFRGGFYKNAIDTPGGELEGSGSSGRIDAEFTVSEDTRKCINLNSKKQDSFGVPPRILSLSGLSGSERKELLRRLRFELDRIRVFRKKVEGQIPNTVTVSSSSDILSCSNGTNGNRAATFNKSAMMTSGPVKKSNAYEKVFNRNSSGKFSKSTKLPSVPAVATLGMMMKQCESLLSKLMTQPYSWVFNEPVDIVKWNIPDYFNVIKHPMDLGTIKTKLGSGSYSSPLDFAADVRLTFKNGMEYNPKGTEAHLMASTLSKFFEVRWKSIEKKLPKIETHALPVKASLQELPVTEISPIKKRKLSSYENEIVAEPARRVMSDAEKQRLNAELAAMSEDIPVDIMEFLKDRFLKDGEEGEELEIDLFTLSDDSWFTLRKLVDGYLLDKQKNLAKTEPCEMELVNESGISNSSMQQQNCNDAAEEDVDIVGNDPPVSSYPPVVIEKDTGHKDNRCTSSDSSSGSDSDTSSESDTDYPKASSPNSAIKDKENLGSAPQLDDKTSAGDHLERNQSCPESVSGLDQLEQTSQQKPSSVESDCHQVGDSAQTEKQVSPKSLGRAAMLKERFHETIWKAREKTISQVDKGDPEKLRREMEELEQQKKKEKARLQAEAKAAEEAKRRAEAAAAAEARRKRELERAAARQALLKMEKTVEINENSQLLEELEMLRSAPGEQLPSSVDETSPDNYSQDVMMNGFKFGGNNPLEQLGLFMKQDEEEDEGDALNNNGSNTADDMEEGEID